MKNWKNYMKANFSWINSRVSANDGAIGKSFQIFNRKGGPRYIKEDCEVRL